MPAINFQKQFIDKILSGEKRQTIRPIRKRPIQIGDTLKLYYGLRTKHVRHLIDVVCRDIDFIEIGRNHVVWISNIAVTNIHREQIAISDGFKDFDEMFAWFYKRYNLKNKSFEGNIIYW